MGLDLGVLVLGAALLMGIQLVSWTAREEHQQASRRR